MEERVGQEVVGEELSRFLGGFRRALLMHRRAALNVMFRLQFPESELILEGDPDLVANLDFRSWLPEQPSDDISGSKLYRKLMGAQTSLVRRASESMDGTRQGSLQAEQVAAFLRAAHVFDQLADRVVSGITSSMIDVDELTGLLNRTAMERDLANELAQTGRTGRKFTIAVVDADHFKRVNDEYGHGFGDHVLETLADRFVESLRPRDQVYRYGGEEFLLLLPDTPLDTARPVLERLRRRAAQSEISDSEVTTSVSVSVGATEVSGNDEIKAAINRADKALYTAKESGRNRVELGSKC